MVCAGCEGVCQQQVVAVPMSVHTSLHRHTLLARRHCLYQPLLNTLRNCVDHACSIVVVQLWLRLHASVRGTQGRTARRGPGCNTLMVAALLLVRYIACACVCQPCGMTGAAALDAAAANLGEG